MNELTFADGIGAIAVVGATVRLDLVTLAPGDDGPGGRPKPSISHRLVMPIDGFLAAARHITEAAETIRNMETPPRAPETKSSGVTVAESPHMAATEAPAKPAAEGPAKPTAPAPKRYFP